jgi:hypothetical protein
MTIPTTGPISLASLQTEFGGSNPISMSEYYPGGAYVAAGSVGYPGGNKTVIPSSGSLPLNYFKGAGKTYYMDILVVGGGGGGGGGGFSQITGQAFTTLGFSGSVAVGSGGVGGYLDYGGNGGDSYLIWTSTQYTTQTINLVNGGQGGRYGYRDGSGGAGGYPNGAGGGGYASVGGSNGVGAGGGGGGIDDASPVGTGGNGAIWSVNGTYYSGGGGGGGDYGGNSSGGVGGGGLGASGTSGTGGTNGLGGGGGGGGSFGGGTFSPGLAGGSGVVIVRYQSPTQLLTGGTVTSSGGYYYHTFTAVGTTTLTA